MTKQKLIETLQRLLETDNNLDFLLKLESSELETLIACLRDKIDYK